MQQQPWSAKTNAPASKASSLPDSFDNVAVRPEVVLLLPHINTPEKEECDKLKIKSQVKKTQK